MPRLPLTPHDIVAFIELRKQLLNLLRLVLEIGVHHNDDVACGIVESSRQRNVVAEITGEALDANMLRIARTDVEQNFERAVPRAIIDEDPLVGASNRGERARKPPVEFRQDLLLIIDRDYDG